MPGIAIDVRGLTKTYGGIEAVKGVDLQVAEGEVFALLGPNGAGKTTTVEILEGHRTRTSGDVTVLGHDPALNERELKERIGIVLQETGVERFLTVAEVIDLYAGYYPHPLDVSEVLEIVGLTSKRDTRVVKLSGGQQRRLDVAVGLAGDPELLFLDEPTTGFDPRARRDAWDMVRNLQQLGKTILLTTHYMDEAQNLADRVAIIVAGEIVAQGSPQELVGGRTSTTISFRKPGHPLPDAVAAIARENGGRVEIATERPTETLHDITSWAVRHDIELEALAVARPNLEDVYLQLTDERESV